MTDNMKRFIENISQNAELLAKVNRMDKAEFIAEARRQGIELTDADFASESDAELSEDELDAVAGGGKCACIMGGSGKEGDNCKECACIIAGGGMFKDDVNRCGCVGAGGGVDH